VKSLFWAVLKLNRYSRRGLPNNGFNANKKKAAEK